MGGVICIKYCDHVLSTSTLIEFPHDNRRGVAVVRDMLPLCVQAFGDSKNDCSTGRG